MLSLSIAGFAQQPANRFEEEASKNIENTTTKQPEENPTDDPNPGPPGNPGEVVPIDDYIPALIFVAIGLIIFNTRRKKAIS